MADREDRPRPPSKAQRLDAVLAEIQRVAQLDGWTSFVASLSLPQDAYPALLTGRPELLAALQPRALTEQEAGELYKALGVLLRTNTALREHAEQVAILVDQWNAEFAALRSLGDQITHFATFRPIDPQGG